MKKFSTLIKLLIFMIAGQNLFAQINVISPVKGTWSNRQVLVIDNSDGGDYFYSINGSDPEKFGFAYDGPVLLDTNGKITLKIAYVARNGHKESTQIEYTVIENEALSADYEGFIYSFFDTGVINYSAGSVLSIPSTLDYSLGLPPDSFIPGQDLSLSDKSILTRTIPCVVWDKASNLKWRFVINTYPQSAGIYSRRDVPFTITDWDTITFDDQNLLYKIDSEYWELPRKPKKLDRSVSHMISWQSLAYEPGNPIEFFVLPPKPEITQQTDENGALTYSILGDESYSMSVISNEEKSYQELFKDIGIDTFYGDKVSGELKIGVFSNSVYQGELSVNYKVDKRPPSNPTITTNNGSFYSRENITGTVECEPGAKLYVAVSNPLILEQSGIIYEETDSLFANVSANNFVEMPSSVYDFTLSALTSGAVYYKLCAFSKNGDNISQISEYNVIIDQYNYYFDSNASNENQNGTIENPFSNFNDCIAAINKSRSVCLKVKGNLVVPEGKHELLANCVIENTDGGSILFEGDSSIVVKNAGVEISNFRILCSKGHSSTIIPAFRLENSVLTIDNCEIGADYYKNATFIDSYNSVINISDIIASVSASSYSSFISAVKSKISIKNSTINANADTCVIISCNEGNINSISNSYKVTGKTGRICELFATEALLEKNTFNAQLSKKNALSPVYQDKACEVTQNQNINYGF